MVSVQVLNQKNAELCIELDANSINLWNKKQCLSEFNKKGVIVLAISLSNNVVGACVFQVVGDEAQVHYFSIHPKFRRNGYGSMMMRNIIKRCEKLNLKKASSNYLTLERDFWLKSLSDRPTLNFISSTRRYVDLPV